MHFTETQLNAEKTVLGNCIDGADKVAALIEQQLKKSLSEEEILYLILHINRLCAREDCDR